MMRLGRSVNLQPVRMIVQSARPVRQYPTYQPRQQVNKSMLNVMVGASCLLNTAIVMYSLNPSRAEVQRNVQLPTMKVKLLRDGATLPKRGSKGAAGNDVYACISTPITIKAQEQALIPLGIAIEIDEGYVAYMGARSGLAAKHGLSLLAAIVDSDYRGEIDLIMKNNSQTDFVIHHGDKVGQIVMIKHETPEVIAADFLSLTERGGNRFGSTGK